MNYLSTAASLFLRWWKPLRKFLSCLDRSWLTCFRLVSLCKKLAGDAAKALLHMLSGLGGGFEIVHVFGLSELFSSFNRHLSLFLHVTLVADEH